MTINKSQGQSLSTVGLFLRHDMLTHSQLYVAISRIQSWSLKILVAHKEDGECNVTSNCVYKEVFEGLR